MKAFISLSIVWMLMEAVTCEESSTELPVFNETVHIYLLMVRDSYVNRLHLLRQEDEDGGSSANPLSFAEVGQNIGNIIQGVVNADLRPIFIGSTKFVEAPNAQQNLGNFFGTIAPGLNVILRNIYTRTQVALGLVTTPKPVTASPAPSLIEYETEDQLNSTSISSNGTVSFIYDYDMMPSNLSVAVGQQQKEQQMMKQNALPPPVPTSAWQYVLNQINTELTTVEPLPLWTRPTASVDEDNYEEEGERIAVVQVEE